MNRTEYFPPAVQPARVGFYEARLLGSEWDDGKHGLHLWDGRRWFLPLSRGRHELRACQSEAWHWRGLVQPS